MSEPCRPAFVHNYDIEIKQGQDFAIGFRALARTSLSIAYLPDTSAYSAAMKVRAPDHDGSAVLAVTEADSITLGYTPGPWEASSAYGLGQKVVPASGLNGFVYECTTAGTSDSGEPTWPVTLGDDVSDGSVEWTCVETDKLVCNVYVHIPIAVTEALTDWGRGVYDIEVLDDFGHSWLSVDGVARLRREATY